MTYNVTDKNMRQAEDQISNLKEENNQQKEEIGRLKEELMIRRDSEKKSSMNCTMNKEN